MKPIPLRCPYPGCNSELFVMVEFDGEGAWIECADDACGALWSVTGEVRKASDLPEPTSHDTLTKTKEPVDE